MSDKPKRYVQIAGGSKGMVVELVEEDFSKVTVRQVKSGATYSLSKKHFENYYERLCDVLDTE